MNRDPNIFKVYKPGDRNQGRDNLTVEESSAPTTNTDQQLVLRALENSLRMVLPVTDVSVGNGPPDIDVGEKIAVEVKGLQIGESNLPSDRIAKAITKKMGDLRSAWRRNVNRRGERLHRYDECWIALTLPMPARLIRYQGIDDESWNASLLRTKAFFDTIVSGSARQSRLQHPLISRVLLLFRTVLPMQTPMYVYNTTAFSLSSCANVPKFPDQPEQSVILEEVLEWSGMQLTSTIIGRSGSTLHLSNEIKSIVR